MRDGHPGVRDRGKVTIDAGDQVDGALIGATNALFGLGEALIGTK
jgi:hypothetical protein